MYFWLVIFLVLLMDQLSKLAVRHYFHLGESVSVVGSTVHLTYIENSGAAFGMFSGNKIFLIVVSLFIMIALIIYRYHLENRSAWFDLSVALIISGSIGNLVDRLYKGMVTDFIHIGWWPIFNIADIAVCVGVVLFGISAFMLNDEGESKNGSL